MSVSQHQRPNTCQVHRVLASLAILTAASMLGCPAEADLNRYKLYYLIDVTRVVLWPPRGFKKYIHIPMANICNGSCYHQGFKHYGKIKHWYSNFIYSICVSPSQNIRKLSTLQTLNIPKNIKHCFFVFWNEGGG